MPEHPLHVLHCALLLRQDCDCPPNHLKRELGQFQVFRQFVQHPFSVVVRIEKPTCLIGEDEGSGRRIGALLLPALKIVRETPGDMDHRQTLLGLSPRANIALVEQIGKSPMQIWNRTIAWQRSTSQFAETTVRIGTRCGEASPIRCLPSSAEMLTRSASSRTASSVEDENTRPSSRPTMKRC
jgi:hypothetical protein